MTDDRHQTDATACSLPGHDRDCALAMLAQSRHQLNPIQDIQVAHLLAIGYRAGAAAVRAETGRVLMLPRPITPEEADAIKARFSAAQGRPAQWLPDELWTAAVAKPRRWWNPRRWWSR